MAWPNAEYPNRSAWAQEERIALLEAELVVWKARARTLADEISNIPKALRQYGEWEITEPDGRSTRVIPAPPAVAREE